MKHKSKKWYKRWWGITAIFIITIILSFFFAFLFSVNNLANEIRQTQIDGYDFSGIKLSDEEKLLIEGPHSYWFGTEKPKVTIVEFGDYSCSMCKSSFSKIREISKKYNNQVKYIFRDYPSVSEQSLNLAMASRCAGEQGLFWIMHDNLFLYQGISSNEEIYNLAIMSGIDEKRFLNCMQTEKYLPQIKKDVSDAEALQIAGTPTWYINGIKFAGDIPYEFFNQLIDKLLNIE